MPINPADLPYNPYVVLSSGSGNYNYNGSIYGSIVVNGTTYNVTDIGDLNIPDVISASRSSDGRITFNMDSMDSEALPIVRDIKFYPDLAIWQYFNQIYEGIGVVDETTHVISFVLKGSA